MSGEPRPLLALDGPESGDRPPQANTQAPPRPSHPGGPRQAERLSPQFQALVDAFDARRVELSHGHADEIDPELVVVLDLSGSVEQFRNAIARIDGLEFLTEHLDEHSEPDDDFHMVDLDGNRTAGDVPHSLYLVMSNTEAINQLISLFNRWTIDETQSFEHGLNKFRDAFAQLRAIRRWGPQDRIRDTGLLQDWQDLLDLIGPSISSVLVEIELWYQPTAERRSAAEARLDEVVSDAGGQVRSRARIDEIAYHAALVELPIQQVREVLEGGADTIQLLAADEIMFVSSYTPMSTVAPADEQPTSPRSPARGSAEGLPRVALLDGLPFANHDALADRLIVDDPDQVEENYPVASRRHGTAMASLIIHGDLSATEVPLSRPLYVRPIMRANPEFIGQEELPSDRLLPDLLHRAVRRIVIGEGDQPASAPSVRIINLSIGSEARAFVRRMSPAGRLVDWMALTYNLLFVVSAGNHLRPIRIPAEAADDRDSAQQQVLNAARGSSRLRGVLPPGDALNALTVGATHSDAAGEVDIPDTVWDLVDDGAPALYCGVGPGVRRSIKPDLYHPGGRGYYRRPAPAGDADIVDVELADATANGPGNQVATPGRLGATNSTGYTCGTSNAAALISRAASHIFDVLEAGADDDDPPFPDASYHPVLTRALLVHASSWGRHADRLRQAYGTDATVDRRELTALLGYGELDPSRLGHAATNRAVLITAGSIRRDRRHTYEIPLPASLRARAEWHRITATLAYVTPTEPRLIRYRAAKVYFETPDRAITAGGRIEAEYRAVRRGSCQHEIIEGAQAMVFGEGQSLPLHIECMNDARTMPANETVRYGLVVSVETAVETSTTIHDEVRQRLRERLQERSRARV